MENEMRKKMRYIGYIAIILLLLLDITFLLSSCTEEIILGPDKPLSGKKVTVNFSLKGGSYGSNVVVSHNLINPKFETVVVPLEKDLFMFATLEEDVNLRATTNIATDGTKVRIAAYLNGAGAAESTADYEVSEGYLISNHPLEVQQNGTYKFVAYSYNSTADLPVHSENINGINPSYDLLWGAVTKKINSSNDDVNITMSHKFSQVKIQATTESLPGTPNITGMSGVTLSPDKYANLEVLSGDLTTGNDTIRKLSWPELNLVTVTSNPQTMCMKEANSVALWIDTLKLQGYSNPFTDLSTSFNKTLQPGVSYTLKASFKAGQGTIILDPNELVLSYHEQTPAISTLTVGCTYPDGSPATNAAWTITVPSTCNWLTLSTSSSLLSGTTTVSGTGPTELFLYVEKNNFVHNRKTNLYYGPENEGKLAGLIMQSSSDPANTINDRTSCVGAFWRNDQIGERIIHIGGSVGPWVASVTAYGENWDPEGNDGVVLTTNTSDDHSLSTEYAGDAESHPVAGTATTVSGTDYVCFRIGLQQPYANYDSINNPARYAVVDVYYNNYASVRRIYLRQGQGPDYVMRPQDQLDAVNRAAAKFSPYNVTAPLNLLNGQVNSLNTTFTNYPSQAGAYFQWGKNVGTSNHNWAWDTYTSSVSNWTMLNDADTWNSIYETCPDGYRRPMDATGNPFFGVAPATTEIRVSLFLNPTATSTGWSSPNFYNEDNSVYGYYADGFFDRRPANAQGQVSGTNQNVAYRGKVFFNPSTYASLFFPTAGDREAIYGTLSAYTGTYGYYFTSSQSSGSAYALCLQNNGFTVISGYDKSGGASVRCVKE